MNAIFRADVSTNFSGGGTVVGLRSPMSNNLVSHSAHLICLFKNG